MEQSTSRLAVATCAWLLLGLSVATQERPVSPETLALGRGWDAAYEKPEFSLAPTAFLVDVTASLEPGSALDVGMGQGRNALHLASKGWKVTGFDVSRVGVDSALEHARAAGVTIDARQQSDREFDWGTDRWDLIVVTYFPRLRQAAETIMRSLRPGGVLVVEAYHRDNALDRPPGAGAGVTFATNELLDVFRPLRVLRYEDVRAVADWGQFETRLVRLLAQKSP